MGERNKNAKIFLEDKICRDFFRFHVRKKCVKLITVNGASAKVFAGSDSVATNDHLGGFYRGLCSQCSMFSVRFMQYAHRLMKISKIDFNTGLFFLHILFPSVHFYSLVCPSFSCNFLSRIIEWSEMKTMGKNRMLWAEFGQHFEPKRVCYAFGDCTRLLFGQFWLIYLVKSMISTVHSSSC